ncbi:hypothetical protein [Streptomyces hyaluromycini]|uniref:hypothetical protein n=1 Tax=Streptomyces hyaluromycini TaxID=1377993 RepID=UPI000B5C4EEF|nr:hypothetical protein [Streptomyces hyaluromycini]
MRAAWSEDDKEVELHTADWEADRSTFGRVRLLNTLADVAAARREWPKFPAPRRDYRREALRAIDGLNADSLNNAHVGEIAPKPRTPAAFTRASAPAWTTRPT